MVTRKTETSSIIAILMAAILAAACPCFAGGWDDLAVNSKKDDAAGQKSRAQVRAKGLTSMLTTKNAAAAKRIGLLFTGQEKRMRGVCAPDMSVAVLVAPGLVEGFHSLVEQYKAGKASFSQVAFAGEDLKASAKNQMASDQTAFVEQRELHATSREAIAMRVSAERGQWLQGQFPGSSISCLKGNGMMVWNQSEIATFREEIAWKVETTEGRLKTTYVALDEGGFNVTMEYGQFSATVALMMPGTGAITPNRIKAAVEEYNAALRAAYEARGIDPNVSNWDAMRESHDRGDSPEQAKKMIADRFLAAGDAVPQMLLVDLAVKNAQMAAEERETERERKRTEQMQTGGVQIQDAPFQIISLSLDSSRETSLSEKDAAVKQNDMIKHVESLYREKLSAKGDIIAVLSLILQDPNLRQSIAK